MTNAQSGKMMDASYCKAFLCGVFYCRASKCCILYCKADTYSGSMMDPVPAFRTPHLQDVFQINAMGKILYGLQALIQGILFPCCY